MSMQSRAHRYDYFSPGGIRVFLLYALYSPTRCSLLRAVLSYALYSTELMPASMK